MRDWMKSSDLSRMSSHSMTSYHFYFKSKDGDGCRVYRKWTKNDTKASKARFRRLYVQLPIEDRFLCGHDIQSEDAIRAYLPVAAKERRCTFFGSLMQE